jgi:translocation and assembly module TamB
VLKPEAMHARLELPSFGIAPSRATLTDRQRNDLSLRTLDPIVIEYTGRTVQVRQAHLVGKETDLTIGGTLQLEPRQAWDLKVLGNLDLGILQSFNENLLSSGTSVINASVRGTLTDPQISGRTELKKASFYLTDFPNGIDNANGVILFDRRRATIERLQANTGGGDLVLTGFVGFGGPELVYQLQARAESVRIRYPEGVSTTANASLTFSGATSKSLLTGVVTVVRAGFNPQTDIASVLASGPAPVVTPGLQNPLMRGIALDIRVETAPNLQILTSLTRDLQAEADLRVRGTAARPVVLGRVLVSQGEIQFFGNRYTINRGEVEFFNPVRIEPVVNLDLETRVRGVLVNISFNGPLNRLNVAYRSDPPLQSADIIALLAVGRAPGSNAVFASGSNVLNQGFLGSSTNNLLGQAVAAPISSRLQRFFGVSRLKIDPSLTGLTAVPQARLTVEQQISRDVTLTYVTNLAQTNQQIMRLEWDINRSWSVVAVREENGIFGVDFFFKRRLR